MKAAFPTNSENGLQSQVFNHFGTARFFILVDTDTHTYEVKENSDLNHVHGQCQPMKALGQVKADAIVVGGIGKGGAKQTSQRRCKRPFGPWRARSRKIWSCSMRENYRSSFPEKPARGMASTAGVPTNTQTKGERTSQIVEISTKPNENVRGMLSDSGYSRYSH